MLEVAAPQVASVTMHVALGTIILLDAYFIGHVA